MASVDALRKYIIVVYIGVYGILTLSLNLDL